MLVDLLIDWSAKLALLGFNRGLLLLFTWIVFPSVVRSIFSFAVVVASAVVVIIVVAFRSILRRLVIFCFIFLLLLWLRFTDCIPEFFFFILFRFWKVFIFQEYFVNVICFEWFFSVFFVMRNEMFIELIT
jgi:hypothetical protein